MGAIKDIIDLVTQLTSRVKDRKVAAELNAIQALILNIQAEQSELHNANTSLREERLALKERIQTLEAQIADLSSPARTVPQGVPTCPNCSTASKPCYMSPLPDQFKTIMNATHRCPQCNFTMKCDQ